MTNNPTIYAYGLDYLRFKIYSDHDVNHCGARLPYADLTFPWFHGSRYVDITGSQLAMIRLLESVDDVAHEFSYLYPCARVDVFVDVQGYLLGRVKSAGTQILNDGKLETIYSHHLKERGDRPTFGRAYDAQAAGHYDEPATRFEIEYKQQYARQLLTAGVWTENPIAVALNHIKMLFGVSLWVENIEPIEFRAPTKRLEHSRERFYRRYGKGIARDIEKMGVQGVYRFIMECLSNGKEDTNDNKGS